MEPLFICPYCYYATVPEGVPPAVCPTCANPVGRPTGNKAYDHQLLKPPGHLAAPYVLWGLLFVIMMAFVAVFSAVFINIQHRAINEEVTSLRASGSTHRVEISGADTRRSGCVRSAPITANEVLWARSRFGEITTDCAVSDRAIIFGVATGDLFAISRANGRIIWRIPVGKSLRTPPLLHGPYVFAASTDGKLLGLTLYGAFKVFGEETLSPAVSLLPFGRKLLAVHADGEFAVYSLSEAAQIRQSSAFYLKARCEAPAALAAGLAVVPTVKGELVAFDVIKKSTRWRTRLGDEKLGRPCIASERVFVGAASGNVYALGLSSGRTVWTARVNGISAPIASNGQRVVVLADDGMLHALRWTSGASEWSVKANGKSDAGPLIHDDKIYCGSVSGVLACFSLKDGEALWQQPAVRGKTTALAVADQILYSGTAEGNMAALGR